MLENIRLIKAIGQFDSVASAAAIDLGRLILVYAENARGKTTLCAVLRSLKTGDPISITERRRLGAANAPEVVIKNSGVSTPALFRNGAWSHSCPEILVFDDVFVDQNICSGMEVGPDNRQNLHDLILGETGVMFARRVDGLAAQIRSHNAELRDRAAAIPTADRYGLLIDDFCALEEQDGIDETIRAAEQCLSAMQNADAVRTTPQFVGLTLPDVDFPAIRELLTRTVDDLDKSAMAIVTAHLEGLDEGAETWIETGMHYGDQGDQPSIDDDCPFCKQPLRGSSIFGHYRAYFSEAYSQLQVDLTTSKLQIERTLGGDALAGFERQVSAVEARRRFWSGVATVPEINIDNTAVASAWQQVRDAVLDAIDAKRADPLTATAFNADTESKISTYQNTAAGIDTSIAALLDANQTVQNVKESVQSGSTTAAQSVLNRLRASKARHTPQNIDRCKVYIDTKQAKETTESDKVLAQQHLETHRATAMPNCETAVNDYLSRLGADFSIARIESQPTGGRPSCVYRLIINDHEVAIGPGTAGAGNPTFKNTLSSGDRNTLALSFFLASLAQDSNRENKIVVLDDPMSSLDKHRRSNTIQQLKSLLPNVGQIIVMSHDEHFLFDMYDRVAPRSTGAVNDTTTLHIRRATVGSTIESWDIESEKMCRHDKRHMKMVNFVDSNTGDNLPVAQSIRPHLEHFLRAAYPCHFRSGETLREFRNRARSERQNGNPIISESKFIELDQLVNYSNEFHHDTNPAADTVVINDTELRSYVQRALTFVTI